MPVLPAKILEYFRNLKSDAVPRSPRSPSHTADAETIHVHDVTEEDNDEDLDTSNEQEEIVIEPDDVKEKEKPKSKKNYSKKDGNGFPKFSKADKKTKAVGPGHSVNTQATGNVINIVGTRDFHWGNVYVNHFGTANDHATPTSRKEDDIKECNLIKLVKEAKIKPDHEYNDYISKNLGKNWHSFFRKLGYKQGRIETFVIDHEKYGIEEARYKLLLDWANNDEDGTLGRLATVLWDEGERALVKDLALIYKTNKK